MRSNISKWAETLLLAVISAASVVALLLLLRAVGGKLWTQEAAGWAQAIGAVIAIAAGFAVASRQASNAARLARRERLEADDDRLTAAFCVAMFAADLVDEAVGQASDRGSARGYLEVSSAYLDFDGAVDALRGIPLHEVRSRRMIEALLTMRRCVERIDHMTTSAQGDPTFDNHDYYEWREVLLEISLARYSAMVAIAEEVDKSRALLREHE